MIIFDMSQVLISNIVMKYKSNPEEIEPDLIRHMAVVYILSYVKRFREKYGNEVVLATDSRSYWRREVFPYYKASRSKDRAKSKFDWNVIYSTIDLLKKEFAGTLPYKVVEVSGAEADDIIAVLAKRNSEGGTRTLIISSDHDFIQLQKYEGVDQFSPRDKAFIDVENPEHYLKEHIISGDKDDGIPNILTQDDIFVIEGGRSKRLLSTVLSEWVNMSRPEDFCTTNELLRNYSRNRMLIDFEEIPEKISSSVLSAYETSPVGTKNKLMNYFIDKGLVSLVQNVGDF